MATPVLIPHDKLLRRLKDKPPQEGKQNAILLSTGSLCPVHLMHKKLVEVAMDHLESTGKYNVLLGYLSPSQHGYVSTKLGDDCIPVNERIKMVELMTQDNPALSVSTWESLSPGGFKDYPVVVKHHLEYFNEILPDSLEELKAFLPLRVFYVCGSDHGLRCSMFSLKRSGVVIVPRPGITHTDIQNLSAHYEVASTTLEDVSSTKIRKCISGKLALDQFCGAEVSEFLYKLYNYTPS